MRELVEQVKQFLIYGGAFVLIGFAAYFLDRKRDWSKLKKRPLYVRDIRVIEEPTEEEIIESLENGTAITAHPI